MKLAALLLSFFLLVHSSLLIAQRGEKEMFKDTLDGNLDFSSFLIDANGFIPVPSIITEPALGGFGGLIAPVFLKQKEVPQDAGYVPPDITAGIGMLTANGSWGVGAFRMGNLPKQGIKYTLLAGYFDINMSFYFDDPALSEDLELEFGIETIPIFLSFSKSVFKRKLYLGAQYLFADTRLNPRFGEDLPGFILPKEVENQTGSLGFFINWDGRNNIFTPDKGGQLKATYSLDDSWTGSDFQYQRLWSGFYYFLPVRKNWISGFRAEFETVFNDPPFYLRPGINMRGIPTARYQGQTAMILETEQRYDFNLRWSGLVFGGLAKAIESEESFRDTETIYNIGGGFRYLIVRQFGIRTGVDIAFGPDSFGYYIVFGHSWGGR